MNVDELAGGHPRELADDVLLDERDEHEAAAVDERTGVDHEQEELHPRVRPERQREAPERTRFDGSPEAGPDEIEDPLPEEVEPTEDDDDDSAP